MLERFYKYRASIVGERTFKEAEAKFEFEIGRAKVRCTIDRIETTTDGLIYIVDLKTGKSKLTKAEAQTDAQMQIYQYAVGSDSAGASLLYLNSELKGNEVREQGPIDRKLVAERIESTAVKMGSAEFMAVKNKNCQFCPVITSCPIQIEGRGLYD
jgi:RecB family exonuclease